MNELELFAAAIAVTDPVQRAALLDRECAGKPELRVRLDELLAAHFRSNPLLDQPEQPVTTDSTGHADNRGGIGSAEIAGTVIAGRYKLLQQIGEGGMGTVWMADQSEPVKRRVALKLMRVERAKSKTILSRFEAERQAIALMDHPHIARLLDAGTTGTGEPFFVMELVKGVPLTEFCDAHKLGIPQRLNLFMQICAAVQHAHQKGIIHRDLKPSNILVESHDGKPVPKVIDFGLAKATTGLQLTEHTLFTAFGSVMGTPLYMAPEQANFNAVDVDTRADVYALGVILYELLTGTTPIARAAFKKAAWDEILKLIREQEAPTPSSRLSSPDSAPSVAANRQMEPAKLGRFVKGELDWIVLKALAKERERRYETATGFARDIERFLNHEPVTAGPPTAAYRLRKFVRRNRGRVIAASLVLVALVVGVIGTTAGFFEARRQAVIARGKEQEANEEKHKALQAAEEERQAKEHEAERADGERKAKLEAEAKRKEAERNLAFAKKGNEILGSVFAGLDPKKIAESGRPLQDVLRQNLSKAVKELEGSAIGEPLEVAAMQSTLGVSLLGLGEASLAVEVFQKSLACFKAKLGPDHLNTLASMSNLATAYWASGQLAKAVTLYEETLEKKKAKLGPDHADTLLIMSNLALAYASSGQLAKALSLYEETLEKQKAKLGPDHPSTLLTMHNLAGAYKASGQLVKAVQLYEETLVKRRATLGPDHPSTLGSMHGLAFAYQDSGQLAKAVLLLEETVEKKKAKLGPDHPDTLLSMNNLATAYQDSGRVAAAKAVPLFQEVLEKQKARLGSDHPNTLLSMNNLAAAYNASGQLAKALPLYQETLVKRKAKLGPDHPETLQSMNNLAEAYRAAGKLDLALPLHEETLKLRQAKFGPDHPDTLISMNNLAQAYQDSGQLVKALPLYEETLEKMKAKLGPDHPNTLTSMNNLAAAYQANSQFAKALPLYEETLKRQKAKLGPDHTRTLKSMNNLATAYHVCGQLAKALPLYEETLEKVKATLGPEHPSTLISMMNLAQAYSASNRPAKAVSLCEETLEKMKAKLGPDHPKTLACMNNLAMLYQKSGQLAKAVPLYEETLEKLKAKLGPDHPSTFHTMNNLALAYEASGLLAKALPLFEETLQKRKAKLGPDHPDTLRSMNHLAGAYQASGQLAKALPLLEETLQKRKVKLGPDHSDTLTSMNDLAAAYWRMKRLDRSIPLFEEALKRQEKQLGRQHPNTLQTVANLGVNYRDAGRLAEAIPLLEESYAASRKHRSLRWVGLELLDGYVRAGKTTAATKLMPQQLADFRQQLPKDSPQLAVALAHFGKLMFQINAFPEAEPLLRECLAIRQKHLPDSWLTFNTQSMIGGALLGQKKYAAAEPLLLKGYEGLKTREKTIPKSGGGDVRIPEALDRLIELYTAINKADEAKKWQAERAKYPRGKTKTPEKK